MNWSTIGMLYWLFWGVSFAVWETYAGLHNKTVPMLTQVVVRYVPWPITMGLLGWALWHFGVRYANPSYMQWLKGGK